MLRPILADGADPNLEVDQGTTLRDSEPPPSTPAPASVHLSSRPPGMRRSPSRPPSSSLERVDASWLKQLFASIEVRGNVAHARFSDHTLRTALQPVLSLAHHKPVGYEALLRAYDPDDRLVSPHRMFRKAGDDAIALDQICRALHVQNCVLQGIGHNWIFLNVSPALILEGHSTRTILPRVLEHYGVPPHRVVVEILETTAYDEENLARCVQYFREIGCLVAIDDFGAGESNFERIWRLKPDIVKLDRSMVLEAMRTPRVRRILPGLVSLIHEAGCLVVMEGLETAEHALIAMESDVDFVQGFYFGEPRSLLAPDEDYRGMLNELFTCFQERVRQQSTSERSMLAHYSRKFESAALLFRSGAAPERAFTEFLALNGVQRCYLLSAEGVQVGANMGAREAVRRLDPRYLPCADAEGANWFRRPYFRRAIAQPLAVQVSRPYLSIADARACVTFSLAIPETDGVCVLCADLDWESFAT
ncbi:MAG TPA: EAL domain-containing protein [Polyangiaceae bacterium]|jgi:EAL domain-containing protein (putative c-di-GMP-specific phosphodiesterase class I)|nr:EAL domain-containing protein [Polyangiaceae bacterium]